MVPLLTQSSTSLSTHKGQPRSPPPFFHLHPTSCALDFSYHFSFCFNRLRLATTPYSPFLFPLSIHRLHCFCAPRFPLYHPPPIPLTHSSHNSRLIVFLPLLFYPLCFPQRNCFLHLFFSTALSLPPDSTCSFSTWHLISPLPPPFLQSFSPLSSYKPNRSRSSFSSSGTPSSPLPTLPSRFPNSISFPPGSTRPFSLALSPTPSPGCSPFLSFPRTAERWEHYVFRCIHGVKKKGGWGAGGGGMKRRRRKRPGRIIRSQRGLREIMGGVARTSPGGFIGRVRSCGCMCVYVCVCVQQIQGQRQPFSSERKERPQPGRHTRPDEPPSDTAGGRAGGPRRARAQGGIRARAGRGCRRARGDFVGLGSEVVVDVVPDLTMRTGCQSRAG